MTSSDRRPVSCLPFLAGLAAIAIGWLILWLADYPRPHVDDPFFTGTAINLCRGGGLTNPWLAEWMRLFGTDRFWVQPPFQPYLLAAWLKIFGVCTRSILGFQCLVGLCATAATLILLRQMRLGYCKCAAVLFLEIMFLLGMGLRPDAAGLALVASAAVCWLRGGSGWWFAGCLFGAAAPVVLPFTIALVAPLGLWSLFRRTGTSADCFAMPANRAHKLVLAIAAAVVIFALFAAAIHLQLEGFVHTFRQHAAMRTPSPGLRLKAFREELALGWEPFLRGPSIILFLAVIAVSSRVDSAAHASRLAAALFVGFVALGMWLYAQYTPQYSYLLAMIGSATLVERLPPCFNRRLFSSFWWMLSAVMPVPFVLEVAFCRPIPTDSTMYATLRSRVSQTPYRVLEFDEYALRYVFDFNPPIDSQDWLQCRSGAALSESSVAQKPAGEAWLVDARKLELYVPSAGVRAERAMIFGRRFGTLVRHPGELYFLP